MKAICVTFDVLNIRAFEFRICFGFRALNFVFFELLGTLVGMILNKDRWVPARPGWVISHVFITRLQL